MWIQCGLTKSNSVDGFYQLFCSSEVQDIAYPQYGLMNLLKSSFGGRTLFLRVLLGQFLWAGSYLSIGPRSASWNPGVCGPSF